MSQILDINLEVDLSEFDSTVTDGGDLSQSGAAALASTSGGLSCLIDDTNVIYGRNDFTTFTSREYRFRIYIDPNALTMASGNAFAVCEIKTTSGSFRARIRLEYNGTNYRIIAAVLDDSSTTISTGFYTITDAEHYVEVLVQYASGPSGNDGVLTLWIDGTQKETITNIDLDGRSQPGQSRIGAVNAIDAGTSNTFYLDEFVLRDDSTEIGAVAAGISIPVVQHHRRMQGVFQ